jgi:hypothetical protein
MGFTVREVADEEWSLGKPAVLAVQVQPGLLSDEEGRLAIAAAFRVERIPVGVVIQTEISIGCTGAHFQVSAQHTTFARWAEGSSMATSYDGGTEVETRGSATFPHVSGDLKHRQSANFHFSGIEQTVVSIRPSPAVLEWSCDSHRGEKAVRDYLMGNLELWATFPIVRDLSFRVVSKPRDRRFFNDTARPLGALASLALFAKLWALRVDLPSTNPVVHEVRLQNDESPPIGRAEVR